MKKSHNCEKNKKNYLYLPEGSCNTEDGVMMLKIQLCITGINRIKIENSYLIL